MRISVSEARSRLGLLCARAQDPRQPIVLTRHGRDIAALVSMEEVERIWKMQAETWSGRRNPLTGRPKGGALILPQGMTVGAGGKIITQREAADQVRQVQLARVDERRVLAEGGLSPVEGGELAVEVPEGAEGAVPEGAEGAVPEGAVARGRLTPGSRWIGRALRSTGRFMRGVLAGNA